MSDTLDLQKTEHRESMKGRGEEGGGPILQHRTPHTKRSEAETANGSVSRCIAVSIFLAQTMSEVSV